MIKIRRAKDSKYRDSIRKNKQKTVTNKNEKKGKIKKRRIEKRDKDNNKKISHTRNERQSLRKNRKKYKKEEAINKKKEKGKSLKRRLVLNKKALKTASYFVFLLISLYFIMFRYSQIADLKYEINKGTKDLEEIESKIKIEKIKIDKYLRSDVIEEKAREKLGMDYRKKDQIEYVLVD